MNPLVKKFVTVFFSITMLANFINAQDSGYEISTTKVKTYFPAYIGNGHFSVASTRLGTLPAESYMIKFYDHGKNDIQRIANLPAWNEVNYFNGQKWLNESNIESDEFENYQQTLDMLNGLFRTSYSWNFSDDKNEKRRTDIDVLTFVSRKEKNLAVIKFEFTTDFSDEIKLSFPLNERQKPERVELAVLEKVESGKPGEWSPFWYPGFTEVTEINSAKNVNGGKLWASSQTEGRGTKAALVSEIYYEDLGQTPEISTASTKKSAEIEIKFRTEKGRKYIFYKLVSVVPEFESNGNLVEQAQKIVEQAKRTGFDKLLADHKTEWKNLWQTDIIIEGDDELQKIVRSMIFYLLCSVDENTGFGIPPMGLATAGYFGHIFWDSDIYMQPPLLMMYPEKAKSLVMFRHSTLKSALENAKINKYKGAMYPWEADEIGKETTPFFAYQNALRENHIVGDVAFSQWQYFTAVKDTNWLRKYGAEVIRETAEFWTSRVNYNKEKDRYEIGKLVSVSEGLTDVSNETYTNTIAKINLELAIKVSDLLRLEKNPQWEEISRKMFIPFNAEKEYHPTFENAGAGEGATELWSSVVNLLCYPLQVEMNENTKRNDLAHAVKSLELHGAGAMMGINFLSIIAAELGSDSLLNFTLDKTLKGYLKPPFYVLSETHENKSVNFLTGAGSFLQQVIFGYTGLRITDDGVIQKYNPMLPKKVNKLTLKNFTLNNKKYDLIVENNKIEKIPRN